MSLKNDLTDLLGSDSVFDDDQTLEAYAADQSFVPRRRPEAVAFAESVEQVQQVVRYANRTATPVIPLSSGLNLHGAAVPREGGLILNLSRMDKIIDVDADNWFAVVEPGVTVARLQDELTSRGLRAMLPFGVPPGRSALTSCVERDPALASASFEYGNDLLMDTEIVLPDGDLFKTGLWSAGGRPGSHMGPVRSMLYRFWTAAQGTLGILTKACIKIEHLPARRKLLAFSFGCLQELLEPLRAIQRKEIGLECFALNRFNLAALCCDGWQVPEAFPAEPRAADPFVALRNELPPWTLLICLSGAPELPEEKIAYEEAALLEITSGLNLQRWPLSGREPMLLAELLRPWGILKKFRYRGAVHDLSFKSPLRRVADFQEIINKTAECHGYPAEDIGAYVLPVERGRAAHCEFDLHCDPAGDSERIQSLWLEAGRKLIDAGAFFDRPYGAWADMMYSRTGEYTVKLRELKSELDPVNILNPGQLCF